MLLEMIINGQIVVDLETGDCWYNGRKKKATIVGKDSANGTRYRYEFRLAGHKKRTIVRNKLVYIAGSRELIPDGCEIHHLDEDRYNDTWNNLILLTVADHLKIHRQVETEEIPF